MDKNTLVGLGLMALIWVGYFLYISPSDEELAVQEAARIAAQLQADSLRAAEAAELETASWTTPAAEEQDSASLAAADAMARQAWGPLAPAMARSKTGEEISISSGSVEVAFSTHGGLPLRATLVMARTMPSNFGIPSEARWTCSST